jgi:phosphatidylglycerol lysyltransferase
VVAAGHGRQLRHPQYDAGLRYIGARVPRGTVALTAFVAYALSNTIGLGPLSGGAVRMPVHPGGLEPGRSRG